jgi:hypothetical protein
MPGSAVPPPGSWPTAIPGRAVGNGNSEGASGGMVVVVADDGTDDVGIVVVAD